MYASLNKTRRGLTLLEVMLAVLIIGSAGVAVMAAFGTQVNTSARVNEYLKAEILAENKLATLRLLPPEDLTRLPDSVKEGSFEPPFDGYKWSSKVEPVLNEIGLYNASVNIEWSGGRFAVRTRVYRPQRISIAGSVPAI